MPFALTEPGIFSRVIEAGGITAGSAGNGIMARPSVRSGLETFPFHTLRFVLARPLRHPLAVRRGLAFRDALATIFFYSCFFFCFSTSPRP